MNTLACNGKVVGDIIELQELQDVVEIYQGFL